jgi:hypothetical protein
MNFLGIFRQNIGAEQLKVSWPLRIFLSLNPEDAALAGHNNLPVYNSTKPLQGKRLAQRHFSKVLGIDTFLL